MRHSIVLSTHPAGFAAATFQGNFEANVARIAALGYEGVELAIRDPALVDAAELASLVAAYGLRVPAIGTGQAWGEEGLSLTDSDPVVRRRAAERLAGHIPVAARFDAVIILGLLRGVPKPGADHAQAMDWLVAGLREACHAAEAHGVRLAVEPLNRYETPLVNTVAEGMALIDRVAAPNLGLLLDTFHMNIEEPSIHASIRMPGARLYHFHVADSNRWPPGGGHLDFAALLETLQATGYTGWVSGEFLPRPDAETAAGRAIEHLRACETRVTP